MARIRIIHGAALAILVLLVGTACGSVQTPEPATAVTATSSATAIAEKSAEGQPAATSAASPTPDISGTPTWIGVLDQIVATNDAYTAENIPVYPGASQTRQEGIKLQHQPPVTVFSVSAKPDDVEAFYKAVLARAGWELVGEDANSARTVIFEWHDPAGTFPHLLEVGIHIKETSLAQGSGQTGLSEVVIWLKRIPYASRVPTYPGASEITRTEMVDEYTFVNQITEYSVDATPEQVELHYKDIMRLHGWQYGLGDRAPGSIDTALFFAYDDESTERHRTTTVALISASLQSSGLTRV